MKIEKVELNVGYTLRDVVSKEHTNTVRPRSVWFRDLAGFGKNHWVIHLKFAPEELREKFRIELWSTKQEERPLLRLGEHNATYFRGKRAFSMLEDVELGGKHTANIKYLVEQGEQFRVLSENMAIRVRPEVKSRDEAKKKVPGEKFYFIIRMDHENVETLKLPIMTKINSRTQKNYADFDGPLTVQVGPTWDNPYDVRAPVAKPVPKAVVVRMPVALPPPPPPTLPTALPPPPPPPALPPVLPLVLPPALPPSKRLREDPLENWEYCPELDDLGAIKTFEYQAGLIDNIFMKGELQSVSMPLKLRQSIADQL